MGQILDLSGRAMIERGVDERAARRGVGPSASSASKEALAWVLDCERCFRTLSDGPERLAAQTLRDLATQPPRPLKESARALVAIMVGLAIEISRPPQSEEDVELAIDLAGIGLGFCDVLVGLCGRIAGTGYTPRHAVRDRKGRDRSLPDD